MMTKTANSLQVAEGDHLWNLAGLAWALRKMVTTTVPVGGFDVVDGWGDVLLWDREKGVGILRALANDRQVPRACSPAHRDARRCPDSDGTTTALRAVMFRI